MVVRKPPKPVRIPVENYRRQIGRQENKYALREEEKRIRHEKKRKQETKEHSLIAVWTVAVLFGLMLMIYLILYYRLN
ncbi:hypothetical protein SNEBB_010234 [Seison nebaliae]|nr:hypothetical protein SNEBB_010234 [Seison nebaliae]